MPSLDRFMASVRVVRVVTFAATLVAAAARPAAADLVLNEVLYDPAGADDGREFVELFNPDSTAASLDGVAIEAGDGARPGVWEVLWRAPAGAVAPPRSPFLIAGSALAAALQNGPDALRLTRGGALLDLLGYGDLDAPSQFEGVPATDAESGESLARALDGVDTDTNAADWIVEREPTPGQWNRPDVRLRLSRSGLAPSPEVAWPGEMIALRAVVRNTGRLGVEGARWALAIETFAETAGTVWNQAASHSGISIAPADSAAVLIALDAPAQGAWRVRARVTDIEPPASDPGGARIPDTLSTAIRIVAGPAVVNEFAFRDAGAGEWIEILFRDGSDDVGALAIADAAATPRPIDRGPVPRRVEAGTLLVVAQDPALARARFGLADSLVLGVIGGWPSLNDTGPEDGYADRVRIVGAGGAPSDAVPYRAGAPVRGGSLERLSADLPSAAAGTWVETIDPRGGTPGRGNSVRAPSPGDATRGPLLIAGSRVLRRSGGAVVPVVLRATPASRGRRLTVRVHDLLGRPLRTLVEGQRFASEGAFVWDGRDDRGAPVPAGLYVVRAEALPEDGAAPRASSLPMAVAAEDRR